MAKTLCQGELEDRALALIKDIGKNQTAKPTEQIDHTVTVICEEDRGLMVCGSAHRMREMFVELIRKRPEFRQVLSDAVTAYGNSNDWKL